MSVPENDFEDLQKLLRCKRYEQPPPGYFLAFSDKVIAQLEVGEGGEYSSWWSWFVARFDAKPVLVCAYGLAVSSLLFMGFRLSQVFEAEAASAPVAGGPWLAVTPGSPILSSHELVQQPPAEIAQFTGFASSRENFHQLLFPRSGFRVQPAGFTLSSP